MSSSSRMDPMAPLEPLAAVVALPSHRSERPYEDKARPAFAVLAAISFSHLLNDTIQSILPAIYPFLKSAFALSFTQIGLMTLALMLTASLLQPLVGIYTDRRPMPYSLVIGMVFSLAGLMLLSLAASFAMLLVAAGLLGIGSSVFHPESSRVARMASGGRHGLAQSLFQVGGHVGSAIGPLIGAFLIVPRGQSSIVWCSLLAVAAIVVLWKVGNWSAAGLSRTVGHAGGLPGFQTSGRRLRPAGRMVPRDPGRAGLFKVLLSGELEQLLHVLSDQQISRLGSHGPDRSLRVSRRGRRRHDPRRAAGRSFWQEVRHLGFDPGSAALHAAAAARELVLELDSHRDNRPDSRLGLFGDRRLRPGTGSRPRGIDLGCFLRARVRDRRARSGCAWPAGRCGRDRIRLWPVRVSAGHRPAGGISSRFGQAP